MAKIVILGFSFLLYAHSGVCQNKNILECLKLIGFQPDEYVKADISLERTDSIIDLKAGYYELVINKYGYENLKLCQAAKFNNSDGTITLGITGYYEDMQCSSHPTFFYEISKSGDSFIRIEEATIIPSLNLPEFLAESKSIEVLRTYFPEIKKTYLSPNVTFEDLLNEVYDFHIVLPRKGKNVKVILTICDYIPTNEVAIDENDWNEIKASVRTIEFAYDKNLKQFKNISKKK